jgi:hypothetical protein
MQEGRADENHPAENHADENHADEGAGGEGAPEGLTPEQLALVAEGCTRSGVVWLRPEGAVGHRLAWHVWYDGAVHVVAGGGEQELPPLEGLVEVVVPSKDVGSRLATVAARAERLWPGTSQWATAAQVLAAKRLNDRSDPAHPEQQRDRWARNATITRLEPVALLAAAAGPQEAPAGSVVPPRAGSTTGRLPFHLGGRGHGAGRRRRRS